MTSFLIVDAQSVKNTDSAEQKGYDAGKKVSGIKRHIAVDTQGLPHAIAITTANVTDRAGALAAFDRCARNLRGVKSVLVDGGYTGEPFAQGVREKAPGHRAGSQTRSAAHLRRHPQALGRRALLRLAREVPTALEKLRAKAPYQPPVRPPRIPRPATQKIMNRFLA